MGSLSAARRMDLAADLGLPAPPDPDAAIDAIVDAAPRRRPRPHAAGGRARRGGRAARPAGLGHPGRHGRAGRPGRARRGRGVAGRLAAGPRTARRRSTPARWCCRARSACPCAAAGRSRAVAWQPPPLQTADDPPPVDRAHVDRTAAAQADAFVRLVEDLLEGWSRRPAAGAEVGRPRACATCAARRPGSTSRSGRPPCWPRRRTPPACSVPAARSRPSGCRPRRTTGGGPTASPTAGWRWRRPGCRAPGWPGSSAAGTTATRWSRRSAPTSSAGSPPQVRRRAAAAARVGATRRGACPPSGWTSPSPGRGRGSRGGCGRRWSGWTLREAELLGVTGAGALSSAGRALAATPAASGDASRRAAAGRTPWPTRWTRCCRSRSTTCCCRPTSPRWRPGRWCRRWRERWPWPPTSSPPAARRSTGSPRRRCAARWTPAGPPTTCTRCWRRTRARRCRSR